MQPARAPMQVPHGALPFILCLYVLLTAALIARVPYGAAPDEIEHLRFVRYVAEQRSLPYFERSVPQSDDPAVLGGNGPGFEYHQPPLYYVVCAPLVAVLPAGAQFHATRFVSLLCGVLTLVLLWRSVRALWPDDPLLAALATGFAALWPLHQSVGAMTNNDAMAGLAAAAVFHQIAQIGARGWRTRDAAILGLLCGLGFCRKAQVWCWRLRIWRSVAVSGMSTAQQRVLDATKPQRINRAKLKSRAAASHRDCGPRCSYFCGVAGVRPRGWRAIRFCMARFPWLSVRSRSALRYRLANVDVFRVWHSASILI
jgi:hypothetical protein